MKTLHPPVSVGRRAREAGLPIAAEAPIFSLPEGKLHLWFVLPNLRLARPAATDHFSPREGSAARASLCGSLRRDLCAGPPALTPPTPHPKRGQPPLRHSPPERRRLLTHQVHVPTRCGALPASSFAPPALRCVCPALFLFGRRLKGASCSSASLSHEAEPFLLHSLAPCHAKPPRHPRSAPAWGLGAST